MDMDFIKNLNIVNNKDISKKLIEIAEYVKSKEDLAEERLRKLEEYDKEEEIAKLKKKIEHLRRNSVAIMSDKEKELYKTFSRRHNEKCGSRSSEIRVSGTGIGGIIKCYCPKCGEIEDITDISSW